MSFSGCKDWYEQLEPQDFVKLAALVALLLAMLTPWRRKAWVPAQVQPCTGELVTLVAPSQGFIQALQVSRGTTVEAGDPVFAFSPSTGSDQPGFGRSYGASFNSPYTTYTSAFNQYQDEEQVIRERYRRQQEEASTYTRMCQEQLSQAYRDQNRNRNYSYEVQLAQNALNRAQQAPYELQRNMEQELASLRSQREATRHLIYADQSQRGYGAIPVVRGNLRQYSAPSRAYVWAIPIPQRGPVAAGQACVQLLPEAAALEVQAAVPESVVRDLRIGAPATLELRAAPGSDLRGAGPAPESCAVRVEKIANQELTSSELAALGGVADRAVHYRRVTFQPAVPDPRLFPPGGPCRVLAVGRPRCLLQRIFS